MRTAEENREFQDAVVEWQAQARKLVDAQETCRVEHAKATLASKASNAAGKKAEVEKTAAYHRMIFARGIHGEVGAS